jgi:hypothetical protein
VWEAATVLKHHTHKYPKASDASTACTMQKHSRMQQLQPHLLWKSPPSSKARIMLLQLAMWASRRSSSWP